MTNWLESEEMKFEENKKVELLKEQTKLLNDQARIKTEDHLTSLLKKFYDLCHRVIKVKPGSLMVSKLKILGTNKAIIPKVTYITGKTKGNRYESLYHRRGINFSFLNPDELIIDLLIESQQTGGNWEGQYSYKTECILLRKKVIPQDIINWQEDKMLNTIQWLILESELDLIKESIPGENQKI